MSLRRKFLNLFRWRKLDAEMTEEMRLHVEMQAERNIATGMDVDEARYAAMRQFGNTGGIQQQMREAHGWVRGEQWWKDVLFALRSLMRAPGFTFTVLATLVLGIGVATTAFDLTSWILFRAQPFPHPEQLYLIGSQSPTESFMPVCYGVQLQAYQETNAFTGFAAVSGGQANIVINGEPGVANVSAVTVNCFQTLGITPALGRSFLPEDHRSGEGDVVVITDLFWREKFHEAKEVLGQKLIINQQVCTVVGVLAPAQPVPTGFYGGDVYRPLTGSPDRSQPFSMLFYAAVCRLAPGVSPEQAGAALTSVKLTGLPAWAEAEFARQRPALQKLTHLRRRDSYWLVFGAAALLYSIACLNAMNLMLVRVVGRRRELSIRLAMGGSRSRIVRLLLLESVGLALAASLVVAAMVNWIFPPVFAWLENNPAVRYKNYWDSPTLGCLCALSVLTCVSIVAVPAWRLFRANLNTSLKEGGPAQGESRRMARMRGALVMLQAAFAVVLLVGTGLMIRSFVRLGQVDLGFNAANTIKVHVTLASEFDDKLDARLGLFERLREKLSGLPGIHSVAYGSDALLPVGVFRMEKIAMADGTYRDAAGSYVSDNFQQTAGLSLIKGRWLASAGRSEVVINEKLARERFGEENPLGQKLKIKLREERAYEVVGVIRDVRESLRESVGLHVYCSDHATYNPAGLDTLILQVDSANRGAFEAMIRRQIYEFDPTLIVDRVSTIDETIEQSLWDERFAFTMLKGLAAIALGLAVVGMFAVVAYTVDSRTKEFGVRLALGATPGDLHRLVMRRGTVTVAVGIALGTLGALALTRFMQSLLFETRPNEPAIYFGVAILLLLATVIACWIPARRATKVDPVVALRAE